ncbi:MAG TPA: radical SAM protein, partial [Spirochaetia bacterium]|nr:radical SAM protein [Spirochaetia bacterium]
MPRLFECLVMAKPVGPACNMRCGYCYYLGKAGLFEPGPWRMPEDLLERYIRQRLESAAGPTVHFEWHGGEPTLLGLDYFRTIVRIQKAHRPSGRRITNGIQTNGLLLDEQWARFLAEEGFSVGLSIDGPADLHDSFRRTASGDATHAQVTAAFHLLKKNKVFCNALCVLHGANVAEPERVYDFFRDLGVTYLQFLPLVIPARGGGVESPTATAEAIGAFLCRIFDRWLQEDVGRVVIQTFDEALRPIYGVPHALCIHRETCGDVAVLEHDGGLYMCDHFVDPDHLVGNLTRQTLTDLMADP